MSNMRVNPFQAMQQAQQASKAGRPEFSASNVSSLQGLSKPAASEGAQKTNLTNPMAGAGQINFGATQPLSAPKGVQTAQAIPKMAGAFQAPKINLNNNGAQSGGSFAPTGFGGQTGKVAQKLNINA